MLSSVQPPSAPSGPNTSQQNAAFAKGSDFTMFLKMLTTQMQNQNPLNPVEAADFAVQLATFSGVEQQVQTNQLLARLTEGSIAGDMVSWLGADVAAGSSVQVSADELDLHIPAAAAGTTTREAVFTTVNGQEVMRMPLNLTQSHLRLDPSGTGASPLLPGTYQVQIENHAGDTKLDPQFASQFARVQEVQKGPTGTILLLSNGALVEPSSVTTVRSNG